MGLHKFLRDLPRNILRHSNLSIHSINYITLNPIRSYASAVYHRNPGWFSSNPRSKPQSIVKLSTYSIQSSHICNVSMCTETVCENADKSQNLDVKIAQDAELICQIVSKIGNSGNLDSALDSGNLVVGSLSPSLVLEVLKRLNNAGIKALSFFRWAEKRNGSHHTPECYNALIESMGKIKQFKTVWSLVNEMKLKGLLSKDTFALVSRRFARAKKVKEAVEAFESMEKKYGLKPELQDYNRFLDTLSKSRLVQKAQEVFDKWKNKKFTPDIKTYTILLEGWGQENNFLMLNEVYHEMKGDGFELDVVSYGILIHAYCKSKKIDEAIGLYNEMETKSIKATPHVYCTLINGLGSEKRLNEAIKFFELCKSTNCVLEAPTYNAMVGAYCWSVKFHEAYRLVEEMRRCRVGPNSRTYDIILHHLIKLGKTQEAYSVFEKMREESRCEPTVSAYEIMVRMFCKEGRLDMAIRVWDLMKARGVIPGMHMFSSLIYSLCDENNINGAYNYLQEMVDLGMRPPDGLFKRVKRGLLIVGREDVIIVLANKIDKLKNNTLVG